MTVSIPRTLKLPTGVSAQLLSTSRGSFATHTAYAVGESRGHVLLVPGWTGSKEDFTPLLPFIAASGFDVTAYDQRGQFETPGGADDDYSLEGFAADAVAVQGASGHRSSHLLGHSFGGLVAQNAVLADAAVWTSLGLLCTGPGPLGEADSQTRPLKLLADAIGVVPLAQIHELREKMTGIKRAPEVADFLARRFSANAPVSLKAMTELLINAPDRIDQVAAIDLPKWVGRGKNDDAWPHAVQADMAARLGVDVVIIHDAAHSPAVENTEETAEALEKFWV